MTSDQRSVGINILVSDNQLAQDAYETFAELATGLRPSFYDHVSVYSTALDEDLEVEEQESTYHDEMTMHKVCVALRRAFDDTDVEHIIGLLHNAGILFRELKKD